MNTTTTTATPHAEPTTAALEVRELSPAEYLFATLGPADLDVPTVRGIRRVPLRGPAYEFELVPMEGGRR